MSFREFIEEQDSDRKSTRRNRLEKKNRDKSKYHAVDDEGNEYDREEKYSGSISRETMKRISKLEKKGKLKYE